MRSFLHCLLGLVAMVSIVLVLLVQQAAAISSTSSSSSENFYLIVVNRAISSDEITAMSALGIDVEGFYSSIKLGRTAIVSSTGGTDLPPGMTSIFASSKYDIYLDIKVRMNNHETVPTQSWALDRIDERTLPLDGYFGPADGLTGDGTHVYVVDTGIQINHPDLGGRADNAYTVFGSEYNDCNGHGTHVAGLIGSNTWGVAKQAHIHNVRVLNCEGSGTLSGLVRALMWIYDHHASRAIVNMSLGLTSDVKALSDIVRDLFYSGVVVVSAAGNENHDSCGHYPSAYSSSMSVAASTQSDERAWFSNYGLCVDIFAPGYNIKSLWLDGSTNTISGTSMAAPLVSGSAALVLQSNPSYSPTQVRDTLLSWSTDNVISDPKNSPNKLLFVGSTQSHGTATTTTTTITSATTSTSSSSGHGSSGTAIRPSLVMILSLMIPMLAVIVTAHA